MGLVENITALTQRVAHEFKTLRAEVASIPAGPQGPPGPKGDSVVRFHNSGPPGTIIGAKPGDEYLDIDTGNLYYLN